jgi:hypothetical protein
MKKGAAVALGIGVALIIVGLVVFGQTHTYSSSADPTVGDTTCGSVFGGSNADVNGSGYSDPMVQDFCDRQRRHAATQGGIEIGIGVALILGAVVSIATTANRGQQTAE